MEEMLRILQEEETRLESGSTGPCMEYLLQHKILETLYTLARTDVGFDSIIFIPFIFIHLQLNDHFLDSRHIS